MRAKQAKCFDFVYRMLERGIRDIIISAPTGVGKSAIGTALGFWSAQNGFPLEGRPGAYYLCTQKLLQDQLESDVMRYPPLLRSIVSLKTASEYPCTNYGDCGTGLMHKPPCSELKAHCCTYMRQKKAYQLSEVGITNYAYFFTERTYAENFQQRGLLVADECHTLESQLLKFIEVEIGPAQIEKYAPTLTGVPEIKSLSVFADWLSNQYIPVLENYLESFDEENITPKKAKEKSELENHLGKILRAANDFETDPENWVYWQEEPLTEGDRQLVAIAKPLSAARYFKDLIAGTSDARVYMSAYPGSKDVFCRTLGLDPSRVAMLTLGGVFPKENRPVHAVYIGSMSKRNLPNTLPSFLKCLGKMLDTHADEKGIIHCNSYALGDAIFEYFKTQPQGSRLMYPRGANEREKVYESHRENKLPTVILSPSFTEGFDFANDFARWQVLAKVPFPYLGDRQVAAKKERDPEWYAMKTVMTVIQASGRICRNESDHGVTYITDSDFDMLFDKYGYMFPNWWTEALVRH